MEGYMPEVQNVETQVNQPVVNEANNAQASVSASDSGNQPVQTPSYSPDEVNRWKDEAERLSQLYEFMDKNPDVKQHILSVANGKRPKVLYDDAPVAQEQPKQFAQPKIDPIESSPIIQDLKRELGNFKMKEVKERTEKEISDIQSKYTFLAGDEGRRKLQDAYKKESSEKYKEFIDRGYSVDEALRKTESIMADIPLYAVALKHFESDYAKTLLEQKNSPYPSGINSRGDRLSGTPALNPDFETQALKEWAQAGSDVNKRLSIAYRVAQARGLDPNDGETLTKARNALQRGDLRKI
jgi:hypothetical protein